MVTVRFPPHLRRFIELPDCAQIDGVTIGELFNNLEQKFPGVNSYLRQENGTIRQHVNVFLDHSLLTDRSDISRSLDGVSEVTIMQALSGG